jgi:hypothetical protein
MLFKMILEALASSCLRLVGRTRRLIFFCQLDTPSTGVIHNQSSGPSLDYSHRRPLRNPKTRVRLSFLGKLHTNNG